MMRLELPSRQGFPVIGRAVAAAASSPVSMQPRGTANRVGLGVFGAEAPNRAARAVGNDTAVANRAGPPAARPASPPTRVRRSAPPPSRPSGRASLTHRGVSDAGRSAETRDGLMREAPGDGVSG